MLPVIITCLIAFGCLCVFALALRKDVKAGAGSSSSRPTHLYGLSPASAEDSYLLFCTEDYRKLRMCPELKEVRNKLARSRRHTALLWLGDLKRDVCVLWKFRRFIVSQGLQVTFGEELAIAGLGCFAVLYLNFAIAVVFVFGPYHLAPIPRNARLPVDLLAARGTALLYKLPSEARLRVEQTWQEKITALGFI